MEYLSLQQYLGDSFVAELLPAPPHLAPFVPPSHVKSYHRGQEQEVDEKALKFLVSNLWMSSHTVTISPLHYDDYENFLFQVEGEKEFLLFPPQTTLICTTQAALKGSYYTNIQEFHEEMLVH